MMFIPRQNKLTTILFLYNILSHKNKKHCSFASFQYLLTSKVAQQLLKRLAQASQAT